VIFDRVVATSFVSTWQAFHTGQGGGHGVKDIYIEYDFPAPVTAQQYSIQIYTTDLGPNGWELDGSTDGITYVAIDLQSSATWSAQSQTMTFSIASPTAYQYYRLYPFDPQNPTGVWCRIDEWQLFG